jgi:hypothetical protein
MSTHAATSEYLGQRRRSRLGAAVVVLAALVAIGVTALFLALDTHTNPTTHPVVPAIMKLKALGVSPQTISQVEAATSVAPQFAGTFINEAVAGAPIGIGPGAGGGPQLSAMLGGGTRGHG